MPGTALKDLKQEAQRRAVPKSKPKVFTVSDFVSKQKVDELHRKNWQAKQKRKAFDPVDQFCAEVVVRFGYEVYEKWNTGEIPDEKIVRWLKAERAREAVKQTHLEMVITEAISACTPTRHKGEPPRKGISKAIKLIRENLKIIEGTR